MCSAPQSQKSPLDQLGLEKLMVMNRHVGEIIKIRINLFLARWHRSVIPAFRKQSVGFLMLGHSKLHHEVSRAACTTQ